MNGYSTTETWNLSCWLMDDENNYNEVRRHYHELLNLSNEDLLKAIDRITGNPDEMDLAEVNIEELRELIRELGA